MSTLIVYPEAGASPTTSIDGHVIRSGVDEALAVIRAGAGTAVDSTNTSMQAAELDASTTTDKFLALVRGIFTFDTSALGADTVVTSAVLSLRGNAKDNSLGGTPALDVVVAVPAGANRLVTGDFSQLGTTVFGSISYADYVTNGYNDITLDANGIANINGAGVSCFGTQLNWDTSGVFGGIWTSSAAINMQCYSADQSGTTSDPKLTITYIPPVAYSGCVIVGPTFYYRTQYGVITEIGEIVENDDEQYVLDALIWNGYIWYARAGYLGRWELGTEWATREDAFATFTNDDVVNHPMFLHNENLYIGDGNLVMAVLPDDTVVSDALDLPVDHEVSTLGAYFDALLVGTRNGLGASVFDWDTYSTSWTAEYKVYCDVVNSFMLVSGKLIAQIGNFGMLHQFTGNAFVPWKRIPGVEESLSAKEPKSVPHRGVVYVGGEVYFMVVGTSAESVWSLRGYDSSFPEVLVREWDGDSLQAIAGFQNGNGLIALQQDQYEDGVSLCPWVLDNITGAFEAEGSFTTLVMPIDRETMHVIKASIPYREMPVGCSVLIEVSVNGGEFAEMTLVDDAPKKILRTELNVTDTNTVQFRVTLLSDEAGEDTPVIDGLDFSVVQ